MERFKGFGEIDPVIYPGNFDSIRISIQISVIPLTMKLLDWDQLPAMMRAG